MKSAVAGIVLRHQRAHPHETMQKVSKAWRAFLRMLAGLVASMSIGVVAVSAHETPVVKSKDQSHNELVIRKGAQIELVAQAPPINLAFTLSETTAPPKGSEYVVGYMTSAANRCHITRVKEGGAAVSAAPIASQSVALTDSTYKNIQSDSGFS